MILFTMTKMNTKPEREFSDELFSISHLSPVLCLHHGLLHVAHVGSHPEEKDIVSAKIIWAILTTFN